MQHVYAGMEVEDDHGPIGFVKAVECENPAGPIHVLVQCRDGQRLSVGPGTFTIDGETLRLAVDPYTLGLHDSLADDPKRTQVIVPTLDELNQQAANLADSAHGTLKVPVIHEELVVNRNMVERGGVRVNKTIDTHEELVEQPIIREEVDVQRVAVGRAVEAAPEVRQEGDTMIIPILEEVISVQKYLVLKEEIHITRRLINDVHRERVTVREEQVQIERLDEREAQA